MKKPTIKEQVDKVVSRYGKTLGASKGKHAKPKPKLKLTPRGSLKNGITGAKAKATIRF